MDRLVWDALRLSARLAAWSVVVPLIVARQLFTLSGQLAGAWVLTTRDALPCAGCGAPVSLVGRFQCGRCRYVFDGFAFARCAVCGAVPPYLECQRCGVGLRHPMRSP